MSDIIKTQQGLARKAETNKTHHFEDVYHLLCKREWVEEALQHVLDNDGSGTAGVDGMSWKSFNDVDKSDFENEKFRQQFIETLQKELKGHTFKPMPVRRVEIPKPGDKQETSIRDTDPEGPDGSNSAQNAHGTHLGGGFLLLLQWISARTLHHGLSSALVHALQHQNRIPMGDRGRHQGVFRPHPARQVSR
jgi:hypothetical protein